MSGKHRSGTFSVKFNFQYNFFRWELLTCWAVLCVVAAKALIWLFVWLFLVPA